MGGLHGFVFACTCRCVFLSESCWLVVPTNFGTALSRLYGRRFMGGLHSLLRMHWDHEPDWHPSPCPLPAKVGRGWPKAGRGAVHGQGTPPKNGGASLRQA